MHSSFQCTVCGFIYKNKDDQTTNADRLFLSFEELPNTWQCPYCGVLKNLFRPPLQPILNNDTTIPQHDGDN